MEAKKLANDWMQENALMYPSKNASECMFEAFVAGFNKANEKSESFYLEELPTYPKRHDSLSNQLADLKGVANKLGMYDAADSIEQIYGNIEKIEYGCVLDLEEGEKSQSCVIDDPKYEIYDCFYAEEDMRKEQCEYWKIIK